MRTHGLAIEICLSVRLSAKRVHCECDKTKEISAHIFIPCQRPIILVFRQEKCLVGNDPSYLKFLAKLTQFLQKLRFSIDISSWRLSGNTCQKVQIPVLASPLRAF